MLRHGMMTAIACAAIAATSCGRNEGLQSGTELSYISWPTSSVRSATIADVHKETIKLCLSGSINPADKEKAKLWTVKATLTWLRALVTIDETITGHLTFSCDQPDLTFRLVPGRGRSYASTSVTTIYVGEPYGTWTHELGHAFAALGDTYTGSTAGACQSGQPQSLMCWGGYGPRRDHEAWSTMWPDDVNGVRASFRKLFPETQAPEWADDVDPEGPFDVASPWPGYVPSIEKYHADNLTLDPNVERLGSLPPEESLAL